MDGTSSEIFSRQLHMADTFAMTFEALNKVDRKGTNLRTHQPALITKLVLIPSTRKRLARVMDESSFGLITEELKSRLSNTFVEEATLDHNGTLKQSEDSGYTADSFIFNLMDSEVISRY
ncbi:hypothetical protein R1flu_002092 [Riccia fluitans]|uniref:Uncharacterized protein n=1 Tax=Riccia fluitans TaxID=41844 RepID=A0ABD1Y8H4_9MARC